MKKNYDFISDMSRYDVRALMTDSGLKGIYDVMVEGEWASARKRLAVYLEDKKKQRNADVQFLRFQLLEEDEKVAELGKMAQLHTTQRNMGLALMLYRDAALVCGSVNGDEVVAQQWLAEARKIVAKWEIKKNMTKKEVRLLEELAASLESESVTDASDATCGEVKFEDVGQMDRTGEVEEKKVVASECYMKLKAIAEGLGQQEFQSLVEREAYVIERACGDAVTTKKVEECYRKLRGALSHHNILKLKNKRKAVQKLLGNDVMTEYRLALLLMVKGKYAEAYVHIQPMLEHRGEYDAHFMLTVMMNYSYCALHAKKAEEALKYSDDVFEISMLVQHTKNADFLKEVKDEDELLEVFKKLAVWENMRLLLPEYKRNEYALYDVFHPEYYMHVPELYEALGAMTADEAQLFASYVVPALQQLNHEGVWRTCFEAVKDSANVLYYLLVFVRRANLSSYLGEILEALRAVEAWDEEREMRVQLHYAAFLYMKGEHKKTDELFDVCKKAMPKEIWKNILGAYLRDASDVEELQQELFATWGLVMAKEADRPLDMHL